VKGEELILSKLNKKKLEFSKRIFIGVTIGVIIVSIFSMYMVYRTNDTSILSYLIGGIFAEFATATGFYYNKSREENIRKIEKNSKIESEGE
jgi:L-cystine uptake protein TcyP (sodium:dicarboxylate symporter family)